MRTATRLLASTVVVFATVSIAAREMNHADSRLAVAAPLAFTTMDLTQGATPEELVNALLGPGMTAFNVTYSGADVSAGTFQGGSGIIPFNSGIVLGSGCISNIVGPNQFDDMSCDNLLPGDPELSLLSGYDTHDATVLEFDFEPDDWTATTLLFSYVFASDEYNEWVYTLYNDVFAFWVNGQNCALVPSASGLSNPVTIDTINNGNPYGSGNATNPVLYRNNDLDDGGGAIDTEMDGVTVSLTCQAELILHSTNHIRLAIADASDGIYDSNVMLLAGSLTQTDRAVSLVPPVATNPVGTTHTVTATVVDGNDLPLPGLHVDFDVLSGPNAGIDGHCSASLECLTDDNGSVSFTYTGGPTPGTDVIRACIDDAGGNDNCAPAVLKHWVEDCGVDGTPCGGPPAACEYQDTCLGGVCQDAGLVPANVECRAVTGSCDLPEFCTGMSADCPLDQHMPDATLCTDGDPCTIGDECTAGVCGGTWTPAPDEVDHGMRIAFVGDIAVLSWNMAPRAISSDVVRGALGALPVGPGGGDEVCIGDNEPASTLRIGTDPPPGDGYWYLVRGVNDCGPGPYGFEASNGTPTLPRVTATCQ